METHLRKFRASAGKDHGHLCTVFITYSYSITGQYYMLLQFQNCVIPPKKKEGVLFHQGNVLAHRSYISMTAVHKAGFEILEQPPCSSDWAPSNFHVLIPQTQRTH